MASDGGIQAPPAKLRFAFRIEVHIYAVLFEDVDRREKNVARQLEMLWPYEVEVVGARVVLGESSELTALEQTKRQIEARRAELPFVIAVR